MALGIIDVKRSSQTSGFNIEKFRSQLANHGYLDNNSFEVFVQPPRILQNSSLLNQGTPSNVSDITKNLAFRIDQVRAPGISIMNSDISRYGVGPTQKIPYTAAFAEVNISVLGDHFCEFWQFWYQWSRAVFEFNSLNSSIAPSYSANYKEDYSSIIMIVIYDHYGNAVQKINLFQAFPTGVREVPLSWGDSNLMKINVSIAFTEYNIEGSSVERNAQTQSNGLVKSRELESINLGITP
jgi:hypothetical protein